MRRPLAALCAGAASLGVAHADEVWETKGGFVTYEADVGTTAVLSAPTEAGRVSVYVPGLGGVWSERRRQSYEGYFIGHEEGGPCEAALQGVDDRAGHYWGSARIVLTERGFPTGLFIVLDPCDGAEELIVGKPVTGG